MPHEHQGLDLEQDSGAVLVKQLRLWGIELGFSQIAVAGIDLSDAEPGLQAWLAAGFHGSMGYMARHGMRRARPAELVPGTVSVITARMDYLPREISGTAENSGAGADWIAAEQQALRRPGEAVVSVYARGRDYHKVLRSRLQALASKLAEAAAPLGFRVFTDSAPVLEVALATRSGLGWRGKHTLALSRDAGSMFFLGEIYINRALPPSEPVSEHCGSCSACIGACPTGAIVAPYRLDARRCISYLTIEHDGAIDEALRPLIGNRIYGCDDCQTACPWNKYATASTLPDFDVREPWGHASLLMLWRWDEAAFLKQTEGSAIRRIGFTRWRRNLAVALGNAWRETGHQAIADALQGSPEMQAPQDHVLVAEHVQWALRQRHSAGV